MKNRSGRGFTYDELKEAGFKRKEALSLGVPIDHRRKNRSEEGFKRNVERLQDYKKRLIVFPRSSKSHGKNKKGMDVDVSLKGRTGDRPFYLGKQRIPVYRYPL